jgi:acetyl-CoA C-acetyltransferase
VTPPSGNAVIVAARRTPIARLDGDLAGFDAQALAASVIAAVVADAGVEGEGVADVILAHAAGPGGNLARRAALDAGLGHEVPGLTIDRQCGGGLDAIVLACRLAEAGAGDLYVAGGVESASTSPLRHERGRDRGARERRFFPRQMFAGGGYEDPGMAESAETIASEWGVSRERQDALAAESHRRAVSARAAGAFDREIVPVGGVTYDSCPRPTLAPERLGRFPSIVTANGTVTAANSSQIADGAAAVVVASAAAADRLGLHGMRHLDSATAGVEPRVCGIGAVVAARRLSARNPRFDPRAVTHVAMTEAFASQTVATIEELELDGDAVNPDGGAIALGHPWAASGAVQVVRLFSRMRWLTGPSDGLALAAIAGGMGTAAWFSGGGADG